MFIANAMSHMERCRSHGERATYCPVKSLERSIMLKSWTHLSSRMAYHKANKMCYHHPIRGVQTFRPKLSGSIETDPCRSPWIFALNSWYWVYYLHQVEFSIHDGTQNGWFRVKSYYMDDLVIPLFQKPFPLRTPAVFRSVWYLRHFNGWENRQEALGNPKLKKKYGAFLHNLYHKHAIIKP